MKKTLLFLFVVISVITQAQPMPIGNRFYQPYIDYNNSGLRLSITSYEDHTAKVLLYTGRERNITIPESFEYEGEQYTITSIEDYAFYCMMNVQSITLPPSIRRIGHFAFFSLYAYIDYLPDSLEYIGSYAFSGCRTLNRYISAKTVQIEPAAFSQCFAQAFFVDSLNPNYTAIDGVLFTKDTSVILSWPCNKPGFSYVVPEGVKRIEMNAFSSQCRLQEITLPQSLREIGSRSLQIQGNAAIHIPGGVCKIEGSPVYLNTNVVLDSINGIPNQHYRMDGDRLVSMDGDTLIMWANAQGEITIPQGIKVIAPECFGNNENLDMVNLPEGITTLGYNSFQSAKCNMNIPSTVKYIGRCACEQVRLDSLILPEGLVEVGHYAFGGSNINGVVRIPSTLKNISDNMFLEARINRVEFSEGLEEIGVDAFFRCTVYDTNAIRFPSSLRRICSGAFSSSSMKNVIFTGSLDTIGAMLEGSPIEHCRLSNSEPPMLYPTFFNTQMLEEIQIPCGTLSTYQNAGGEWDKIADSLFVENCESIASVEENSTYLMPNPASETVTVASSFRIAEVELFSLDGRSLLRSRVDAMSTALNLDGLAAGTYIVRIATNGGTAYKKLVVK